MRYFQLMLWALASTVGGASLLLADPIRGPLPRDLARQSVLSKSTQTNSVSLAHAPDVEVSIKEPPSPAEWRQFMAMNAAFKEQLWKQYADKSVALKDWSWQWRMAWLRSCRNDQHAYCMAILKQALSDQALVVRAFAAEQFGVEYEGSADEVTLQLLADSYRNPMNYRRGKPMYIQERILFAIMKIGGVNAQNLAQGLAQDHKKTLAYFQKINHAKL